VGMRRMLVVVTRHTSRRAAAARARPLCASAHESPSLPGLLGMDSGRTAHLTL
jgi:hypothetical protein